MSKARVTSGRRKQPAFSLIELLIVVGIIAVLVGILIPALNHAREQARTAVCLSNLRQLAYAMESYFQDSDAYPIYAERFNGNFVAVPWAWGGRTPALEPWRTLFGGAYWVTATERPFNRYLGVGNVVEPDPITADNQRAEIEVYHCPSDRPTGRFRWNPPPPGLEPKAAYDDIGTSYQINSLWAMQWHQGGTLDDAGRQPGLAGYPRWIDWGARLLRRYRLKRASRFLLLLENPMEESVSLRTETMGFHHRMSRHNALMLDGHAQMLHLSREDLERTPFPYGAEWTYFDEVAVERGAATSDYAPSPSGGGRRR